MRQYFFRAWPTFRIDLEHETKEVEKLRNIGLRGSLFRMLVFFFNSIVFKSGLPVSIGDLLRDSWARKSVDENIFRVETKVRTHVVKFLSGLPVAFPRWWYFAAEPRHLSQEFVIRLHQEAP